MFTSYCVIGFFTFLSWHSFSFCSSGNSSRSIWLADLLMPLEPLDSAASMTVSVCWLPLLQLELVAMANNSKWLQTLSLLHVWKQKYSRPRCLLRVKGLVICFYLGWFGSILQFRQKIIKVGSKSWLLACSSNITLSLPISYVLWLEERAKFLNGYLSLLCFCLLESVWKNGTGKTVVNFASFVHRRLPVFLVRISTLITFRIFHDRFQCTAFIFLHFKCLCFNWHVLNLSTTLAVSQ